jgi:hypothetical protein
MPTESAGSNIARKRKPDSCSNKDLETAVGLHVDPVQKTAWLTAD